MLAVNKNPSAKDLRSFGRSMLLGFGLLGIVFWYFGLPKTGWTPVSWNWTGGGYHVAAVIGWILGVVLFAASFSPAAGRAAFVGWMTVAGKIGGVMTIVILTVLYFVLLPVFTLIRFSDPLRFKLKPGGSYWEDHPPHEPTLERMSRPF